MTVPAFSIVDCNIDNNMPYAYIYSKKEGNQERKRKNLKYPSHQSKSTSRCDKTKSSGKKQTQKNKMEPRKKQTNAKHKKI